MKEIYECKRCSEYRKQLANTNKNHEQEKRILNKMVDNAEQELDTIKKELYDEWTNPDFNTRGFGSADNLYLTHVLYEEKCKEHQQLLSLVESLSNDAETNKLPIREHISFANLQAFIKAKEY